MSNVLFVTYDGDCCYFEKVDKQQEHASRIARWLNSGTQLSVLAFNLVGKSGLDMLVAVGKCCHGDLHDSLCARDMTFKVGRKMFKVADCIGGFCVKKDNLRVIYTRDSEDFGGIKSTVGNLHRQQILHHLTNALCMENLNFIREARKKVSPECKRPILSFAGQLKKINAWRKAYALWKYEKKGGFPETPANILKVAAAAPKLDGFRPATEINFYLSTPQEHLDFVFDVLWKLELKKPCTQYGDGYNLKMRPGAKWPGKTIAVVGIDIEAYREEEGLSAQRIGECSKNPIHVESFTHLLMHGVEYLGYVAIPGFTMSTKDGGYHALGYRVITGADGVAISGEYCARGYIAERMF